MMPTLRETGVRLMAEVDAAMSELQAARARAEAAIQAVKANHTARELDLAVRERKLLSKSAAWSSQ